MASSSASRGAASVWLMASIRGVGGEASVEVAAARPGAGMAPPCGSADEEQAATTTAAAAVASKRTRHLRVQPYLDAAVLALALAGLRFDARPIGAVALDLDAIGGDALADEIVTRVLGTL